MLIQYKKNRYIAQAVGNSLVRFKIQDRLVIAEVNTILILGKYQWTYSGSFTAGTVEAMIWANSPGHALNQITIAPELGALKNFKLTQVRKA